jgi:hypothetical protein
MTIKRNLLNFAATAILAVTLLWPYGPPARPVAFHEAGRSDAAWALGCAEATTGNRRRDLRRKVLLLFRI